MEVEFNLPSFDNPSVQILPSLHKDSLDIPSPEIKGSIDRPQAF
jgi:hypothetical protein